MTRGQCGRRAARAWGRQRRAAVTGLMLGAALLLGAGAAARAAVFPLPAPGADLIGELGTATVGRGETLLDIARRHGLGYNEIIAANPGLDPWLPPVGAEVTLPTRFILPSAPRKGIIVNVAEMRLYYYPPPAADGRRVVMTFPIGIGQEGWSTPVGITQVVEKIREPAWTVPESIRAEYRGRGVDLPKVLPPGPDNPLGRFALRLGNTSYLIHGTNKPYGVGMRVSHGCIRLYPEDIETLFGAVAAGTDVWIIDQPYKLGRDGGWLYLEAHAPITEPGKPPADNFTQVLAAIAAVVDPAAAAAARATAVSVARIERGIPAAIAEFRAGDQGRQEGWMLQLGAFANRANAARLAQRVTPHGMAVSVQARVDGYCHVLVGPYEDEGEAARALKTLEQATGYTGKLLRADRPGLLADCLP